MKPGHTKIISCPTCKASMLHRTLLSGSTFWAVYWSDGKMEAPMWIEYPVVTKCYCCGEFFWIKDAPVLGYIESHKIHRKIKEYTTYLTIEEYAELLRHKDTLSSGREMFVRLRLWWTINDLVRRTQFPQLFEQHIAIFTVNILSLIPLTVQEKPADRLKIAEMHRQIREFNECLDILDALIRYAFLQ